MTYTKPIKSHVPEIKDAHAKEREGMIQKLSNFSFQKLLQLFISEMDAKNKAYYFIIESGNVNNFHEYCKKRIIS